MFSGEMIIFLYSAFGVISCQCCTVNVYWDAEEKMSQIAYMVLFMVCLQYSRLSIRKLGKTPDFADANLTEAAHSFLGGGRAYICLLSSVSEKWCCV